MPDPRRSEAKLHGGKGAVVVGGGLAGLAAAVELANHGVHVTIVERNAHLGGKMNVHTERGFTFDMGPTIITLPQVLLGIIERTGRSPDDYVELVRLDPQWRCFYEDGTVVDLAADPERFAARLERDFPGTAAGSGYLRFLEYSRRMFRLSEKVFFYQDVGSMRDMMRQGRRGDPEILRDVLAMRAFSTVGATAHKMIDEPHVRQLVEHFLQYIGSSPFLAPAILSLIASAQVDHGCWYPMGGTRRVAGALARLAEELDVRVVCGVGVKRIEHGPQRVEAVVLDDGRRLEADLVVSNCDVQRTYRSLLGDSRSVDEQRNIGRRYEPACSGVVFYLGLDRQYDQLAHHDFLFSSNSRAEFGDIYGRRVPASDPTLYLAVPSRTDPHQAPPGGEALYVLIHTPPLQDGARWRGRGGLLEWYRPIVLEKLKRMGLTDLEKHIVVEHHLTPDDIERMYNAEGGAIYGLASHGRFRGGFKPRNRSRVFPNLYLAGGSANPGPGVPMVLMSGVTAARAACEDLGIPLVGETTALGAEAAVLSVSS